MVAGQQGPLTCARFRIVKIVQRSTGVAQRAGYVYPVTLSGAGAQQSLAGLYGAMNLDSDRYRASGGVTAGQGNTERLAGPGQPSCQARHPLVTRFWQAFGQGKADWLGA